MKIYNQLTKRPPSNAQVFTGKSQTIPGQQATAQEIMRMYRGGMPPNLSQTYLDQNISQFDQMSKIEKHDYLLELTKSNARQRMELNEKLKEAKEAKIEKLKQQQVETLKKQLREELKNEKRDDFNDAK